MRNASNVPHGSLEFRQAPLGAGGYVIGMDLSADASRKIHWADVWNGYIRDEGDHQWRLMLRDDNFPENDWNPRPATMVNDSGIYTARIAPSNKDIIYCSYNGYIYKTTNGTTSWTRTAATARNMESNYGAQRRFNRCMDIHPTNPNIMIYGTNNDGVHYTTNGGTSFTAVSGLPSSAVAYISWGPDGKYLVGIDPGNPNYVYIHASGTGLYRSTTGVTGTFTLVAGAPASISCLSITPSGDVFMVEFRTGVTFITDAVKKLARGGSSYTALVGTTQADQVAVNPLNEDHIALVEENGGFYRQSYDGGATWVEATWNPNYVGGALFEWTRGDGEVPWLCNDIFKRFPAHLIFDPATDGKLWCTEGVGLEWSTCPAEGVNPTNANPWVWHDYSRGNEELVPVAGFSAPDNPVVLMCSDKPFWRMDDPVEWTNIFSAPVAAGNTFNQGYVDDAKGGDYAGDNPDFMVGVVGKGNNQDGYSINGGRSWVRFPTTSAGFAGWVAVSTTQNFIRTAANHGPAQYTLNGGATWNNVSFGGYAVIDYLNSAYYVIRENVSADKTTTGKFALLVSNVPPQHRTPVTITIASPGVVTWAKHSLVNGWRVNLTTTGALPTGITAGTNYFIVNATTDTFQLSLTSGGAAINTTGSQSGTHTGHTATDYIGRNIAGIWVTTDGGVNWTQTYSGCIQTQESGGAGRTEQYWQCGFTYVPDFPNEILYADFSGNANNRFFWSQDDGDTWTSFTGVRDIRGFSVGKAVPGSSRPAIYFYGLYNSVKGFYVSYDWFATPPTFVSARPINHIGGFGRVTADINVFGRAFIAVTTQGFAACDYVDEATAT